MLSAGKRLAVRELTRGVKEQQAHQYHSSFVVAAAACVRRSEGPGWAWARSMTKAVSAAGFIDRPIGVAAPAVTRSPWWPIGISCAAKDAPLLAAA